MILTEENINKISKKLVIEMSMLYGKRRNEDAVDARYNLYYDCGTGIKRPNPDGIEFDFAMDITKKNESFGDIFSTYRDTYFAFNPKVFDQNVILISNEAVRKNILKRFYEFGMNNNLPVFLQINDKYFFLNETKFKEIEEINEVTYKDIMPTLDSFVKEETFGQEYKKYKSRLKLDKEISEIIYKHKRY